MGFLDRTITPKCPACDDDGGRCEICGTGADRGCVSPVDALRAERDALKARVAELEATCGVRLATIQVWEKRAEAAEARVKALEKELTANSFALKHLMDALDIDPAETRIDIKGASGVVASVTFAELASRVEAALRAGEVPNAAL